QMAGAPLGRALAFFHLVVGARGDFLGAQRRLLLGVPGDDDEQHDQAAHRTQQHRQEGEERNACGIFRRAPACHAALPTVCSLRSTCGPPGASCNSRALSNWIVADRLSRVSCRCCAPASDARLWFRASSSRATCPVASTTCNNTSSCLTICSWCS